jgi:DMSO/TMAO reductase YedYZ molybdopterin-dependent catalytic subunit
MPNEAIFVRWQFAGIPTEVDAAEWRLDVTGSVNRPMQLSLDDLRHSCTGELATSANVLPSPTLAPKLANFLGAARQ